MFRYIGIGIASLTGVAVFIILAYSIYSHVQEKTKKKARGKFEILYITLQIIRR